MENCSRELNTSIASKWRAEVKFNLEITFAQRKPNSNLYDYFTTETNKGDQAGDDDDFGGTVIYQIPLSSLTGDVKLARLIFLGDHKAKCL